VRRAGRSEAGGPRNRRAVRGTPPVATRIPSGVANRAGVR
jgi:hypothetical protein